MRNQRENNECDGRPDTDRYNRHARGQVVLGDGFDLSVRIHEQKFHPQCGKLLPDDFAQRAKVLGMGLPRGLLIEVLSA